MIGILVLPLVGAGVIQATRLLTKNEEIQLKQQMKPRISKEEQSIDLIGIFPPQFEESANSHLVEYEKAYGKSSVQVIAYKGFTLIVPPGKTDVDIETAKKDVDVYVESEQKRIPISSTQENDIDKIREVFGIKGKIVYNSVIDAYTDKEGYQYNFYKGELMNKQIGITPELQNQWNKYYPHLADSAVKESVFTETQAKANAEKAIGKMFTNEKASKLKTKVQTETIDNYRLGIVYGNNEVRVMIDKVTGDIIYYGKVK